MTADARMQTDREIVISRLIDAPRTRVFEAWTDPEQMVGAARLHHDDAEDGSEARRRLALRHARA